MYKSMSPLMFNRKNTVTINLDFCVGEIYQHVSRGIHRQIAPSDTQYWNMTLVVLKRSMLF